MRKKGRCQFTLVCVCVCVCGIFTVTLVNFACSTSPVAQSENVKFGSPVVARGKTASGRALTRADLQNAILRFETEFTSRTYDALRPLTQSSARTIRKNAVRANLIYAITSLDIALGAIPEQNLLDMLTYIELIRDVFRDYWIPNVYGKLGLPVLRAFDESSRDLREIALAYLTPEQISEIKALVDAWHTKNPERIAVESVRLSDFSAEAGNRARQLQSQVSGFFAPISGAMATASQGILLAERSLYYAQRAPNLFGMQSTATLQDALKEVTSSASEFTFSELDVQNLQAVLAQSEATLKASRDALKDLRPVLDELRQLTDLVGRSRLVEGSGKVLDSLTGVMMEYNRLSRSSEGADMSRIVGMTKRIQAEVSRLFRIAFLSCLVILLFAGLVYVLARLAYDHFSRRRTSQDKTEGRKAA